MSKIYIKKKCLYLLTVVGLSFSIGQSSAVAGDSPFLGDVMAFGGDFCPRGWAKAEGQLLAVSQNDALFSLYGTLYGGDGRTTFGLPDLRGRILVGAGQGVGLSNRVLGSKGGSQSLVISAANLAGHTHPATTTSTLKGTTTAGTTSAPGGNTLADDGGDDIYNNVETPDITMNAAAATSTTSVSATGGSAISLNAQQPYLAITHCVALFGTYPSRN